MSNDINEILDELEQINDELMEDSWRNELGINEGNRPVTREEEFPNDYMLPDFELEEDELLINREDY